MASSVLGVLTVLDHAKRFKACVLWFRVYCPSPSMQNDIYIYI